jgi:hypothetical protein
VWGLNGTYFSLSIQILTFETLITSIFYCLFKGYAQMRSLFTVQPTIGHLHAMMPLAEALKDHGHEVAFATASGFGERIEHLGYLHFPCGVDFDGSTDVLDLLSASQKRSVLASFPDAVPLQQLQAFIVGLVLKPSSMPLVVKR